MACSHPPPTNPDEPTLIALLTLATLLSTLLALMLLRRQRRMRRQWRTLLEQLECGVIELERDRVHWHNAAATSLLGDPKRAMVGVSLSTWLPDATLPTLDAPRTVPLRGLDGQSRSLQISRIAGVPTLILLRPVLGEAERYQRSQYFARIGTWDWDIDTDRLY